MRERRRKQGVYLNRVKDRQLVVSTDIIPVECCLLSEKTQDQGLACIGGQVFEEAATTSYVPLSWMEAKKVLLSIGDGTDELEHPNAGQAPARRSWAMRGDIHRAFLRAIRTPDSPVGDLAEDAAREAMEGAIELRRVLDCCSHIPAVALFTLDPLFYMPLSD